jgi:hypothetical protein
LLDSTTHASSGARNCNKMPEFLILSGQSSSGPKIPTPKGGAHSKSFLVRCVPCTVCNWHWPCTSRHPFQGMGDKEWIFHFGKSNSSSANSYVGTELRKVLQADIIAIICGKNGKLGTHSTRKYGTTAARRRGGQKDFVDYRARWKQSSKQQDKYANADLPWPDGDMAARLCVGGPIRYQVKSKSGINTE